MASRKPERCLLFTEESLAALPNTDHYMNLWFDTEQTYLTYRNIKGRPAVFQFLLTNGQLNALRATGKKSGRLINLGGISLKEARERSLVIYSDLSALEIQNKVVRKRGRKPLVKIDTSAVLDKLLKDAAPVENPDYDSLMSALMDAYDQARNGKGAKRHAAGLNFEDQDMLKIIDAQGTGFSLGQALKKIIEGKRLIPQKAREEYLGAIVYIAGTIVWLDRQEAKDAPEDAEAEGS